MHFHLIASITMYIAICGASTTMLFKHESMVSRMPHKHLRWFRGCLCGSTNTGCLLTNGTHHLFLVGLGLIYLKKNLFTYRILLIHHTRQIIICLVWRPGQNKRILPFPFFHRCRKRQLKD
jgi:hypothetical protein